MLIFFYVNNSNCLWLEINKRILCFLEITLEITICMIGHIFDHRKSPTAVEGILLKIGNYKAFEMKLGLRIFNIVGSIRS